MVNMIEDIDYHAVDAGYCIMQEEEDTTKYHCCLYIPA